jgi:serine/threonine protein kinase
VALGWGLFSFLLVAGLAIFFVWHTLVWFPWLVVAGVQIPLALGWSILSAAGQLHRENRALKRRMLAAEEAQQMILEKTPALQSPVPGQPATLPKIGSPFSRAGGSMDDEPSIPDHELLQRIGKGAYGEVWLARNAIGTFHAVKIVHRRTFTDDAPFEREFNGLRRFMPISRNHPGFVHILHVGRNDKAGYIYYSMEAADDEATGQKIDPGSYSPRNLANELRRRKRLPLGECIRLGLNLTAALDFLHRQQLIHRDIKPANIIFVNGAPKLADIGLVTEAAQGEGSVTYLGTKGYIPPEGPATPAGDVYSVGKVLYEASVGFDVSRFPELPTEVWESGSRGVGEPGSGREDAFFKFNALLLKACENEPAKRYPSAADLHQALAQLKDIVAGLNNRTHENRV